MSSNPPPLTLHTLVALLVTREDLPRGTTGTVVDIAESGLMCTVEIPLGTTGEGRLEVFTREELLVLDPHKTPA